MLRSHPLFPAFSLALGMFVAILAQLYGAFSPSVAVIIGAGIAGGILFLYGRFFLCGALLGVLAVGLNTDAPYRTPFSNCQFQAQIAKPNYTKRFLGQEVRLFASHIRCAEGELPDQLLQYWDNRREMQALIGQRLSVSAQLQPVHSRLNPQQFDYEKYLISQGIRLSAKKLRIDRTEPESNALLNMRHRVAQTLREHLSDDSASILIALLTGNRTALSPEQKATMQATGTSHLLAISGLHLALMGGVSWLLFQWLWGLSWRLSGLMSPRHAGAWIALVVITAYAIFTGFDVPVKRAWVMFSLLIVSWLLLRGLSASSLFIAASVVMFVSPYAVVSEGFYFSFIATFIVLWSVRLPYSPLVRIVCMQGIINLTLFSMTWYAFGVISLSAFFVNALIIPWLGTWVLPWAIFALILQGISPVSVDFLWRFVDETTSMLWQTIAFAEKLQWTLYPDARPMLIAVIVAVVCIILTLLSGRKWLLLGVLSVFLPAHYFLGKQPEMMIADRRYTSALFHNGKTAILINAGRKYKHINDAKLWRRYLQEHQLTLGAIVLENDKVTRISATKWLLDAHPNAKVVTLAPMSLPYPSEFCTPLFFDEHESVLRLDAQANGKRCHASLHWQDYDFALFPKKNRRTKKAFEYALRKNSVLQWRDESYASARYGAIRLRIDRDDKGDKKSPKLILMREEKRLWRVAD